jgi:hypothetical protein
MRRLRVVPLIILERRELLRRAGRFPGGPLPAGPGLGRLAVQAS